MRHLLWIPAALLIITAGCKKDSKSASVATLTTVAPASVTTNGAQTGGNITGNGGSTITQRGVCWATHSGPTVGDSLTKDGTGTGAFTTTLSNLYSFTKYYVRAYAINGTGTAYGDEQSFTTSMGLASLTTTAISGVAPLTATSGGNIISDGGADVTARGVVWATTAHPTTDNFKTSDSLGKGVFISALTPLASQVTYYARAYAVNSFGTAYGNEISFTSSSADAVTDIDGNVYGYITIGTQTWMTSNLKTGHYRNGDSIANGFANSSAFYSGYANNNNPTPPTVGAYTYPGGNPNNNNIYGKYYDNLDIQDSRGICPANWHIPSDDEWKILEAYEGMSQDDADATSLRGSIGGNLLEGGASGLNLQLSGYVIFDPVAGAQYQSIGDGAFGVYWSSTLNNDSNSGGPLVFRDFWLRAFNVSGVGPVYRTPINVWGMAVRCVKD